MTRHYLSPASEQQGCAVVPRYSETFDKSSCGVGFVAHIKGQRSHQIVQDAATVLLNMDHRGGCGCEANTGDGAGMLTAMPHEFLAEVLQQELQVILPAPSKFGAGLLFLPTDVGQRNKCKQTVERIAVEQGQQVIAWRQVPTQADRADIGPSARACEPAIEQVFIAAAKGLTVAAFERQLYLISKRASHRLRGDRAMSQAPLFFINSLSTKVLVYKGMLKASQLMTYYPDLQDPRFTTHLAMVHSRFSTNTFPSWDRAQPNRLSCHNGEINTLRGNNNWMAARQGTMRSELFGEALATLLPVIEPDCSDSGSFDNTLEFLLMNGRSLPESIMMMVPEAWQKHADMPDHKRAFYQYHACLMEPWDGPASIVFSDGKYIGAVLDRNGLRPSRYYQTHDDLVIMASEVGVLPVEPERVKAKGRLHPGRMFLVDFEAGRLIPDDELKQDIASRAPYRQWLCEQGLRLSELPLNAEPPGLDAATLSVRLRAFGYTTETLQFMLLPLAQEQRDPLSSMGNDAALACLSEQPRMLYDYFKQLFAQVTNPAIDSIREELVMSLESYLGPEANLLTSTAQHCHRLWLPEPLLSNQELTTIKYMKYLGHETLKYRRHKKLWQAKTIDITFPRPAVNGREAVLAALDRICAEARQAIDEGYPLVVLSDRATSATRVPLSSLMACGAVHHHLLRHAQRTRVGLVVETGEAREVHHHCLLLGYGADAINPYLAYEALWQARRDKRLAGNDLQDDQQVVAAYRRGVAKGMLKVLAKMGISTLQSYKGAQIFEALGLKDEVIERCFTHTPSRIQGADFTVLAEESLRRHALGYPARAEQRLAGLPNPGEIHWRAAGEHHAWEPVVISHLQVASRSNSATAYQRFADAVNDEGRHLGTLRSLLKVTTRRGQPIPLEQVEPAAELVKRFSTGAMSYGSISAEAHETLAVAMNRIGGMSNTGEGGEDPARFKPLANGDSKRSAIKQVASGRFGVTAWYLSNADELQIKIAQGAKPGEGGELPGGKVDQHIARIRYSTPGVGLISPPPHHDIYSIEDFAQLVHDLKNANPDARISVKLVAEVGVGTIAAGVAKARVDHIVIAGEEGGTGASPLTSIKHAGLPWELGLAEAHRILVQNDLRSRVVLQADGGMKTGRDVLIAACLGAEEIGFSTAPLIALGCIMMRKCHLNICPVGIATQDPVLRTKFSGQPEHVINYLFLVAQELRRLMAQLGIRRFQELIGRVDLLTAQPDMHHWKARHLDLSPILSPARKPHPQVEVFCTQPQEHNLEHALDHTHLLAACASALETGERVELSLPIKNTNRTVGTLLSHHVVRRWGEHGLADDTLHIKFQGSAGQSFGAFLAGGITLELEGDANDYVGKGLSGGRLILYPPKQSTFAAEDNILLGNVVLYGATAGQAFFRGQAAERFCVRNSGAWAVIEGVGDHACEYMTGGRVLVLGPTGRNFAAGMSGGLAYVWAPDRALFQRQCNLQMVTLETVETEPERTELSVMLNLHAQYTGSTVAARLLKRWPSVLSEFVQVLPRDYQQALLKTAQAQ